jgi:hypothetical protein
MNGFLASLKGAICNDPRVVIYLNDPSSQNVTDIAGIVVDILSASTISVPVGTLTVLIVKGRLQNLCA